MKAWHWWRQRYPAVWIVLLAALGAGQSASGQVAGAPGGMRPSGGTRDGPDAVEAYLLAQMRINQIPSIAIAIIRDGRTELLRSYGTANLEWDAAANVATTYQLASATKPLTGTAVMLLVQEGRLSLDESVRTYLRDAPPEWGRITIGHLATHASGISDDLGDAASNSAADATHRLMGMPLVFEPGARSSYGIGGYAVLQHVIEQVSGMTFPRFMRERVLDPLGMTNTRFDHTTDEGPVRMADVVPHRAQIYSLDGEAQRVFWFRFGSATYTAGGLLSSAEDLAKWAAALDKGQLLTAENCDRMWQASNPAGSSDQFGIGWAVGTYRGRRTVGHSGGPALADILRFPQEKLTIVVLTNQSRMYPYLAQGVADLVVAAPAQPAAPAAIVDFDLTMTQKIRDLLDSLSEGEIPDASFTAEARGAFLPQVRTFLPPYTRSLGAPSAVQLVDEDRRDGRWERVYRVSYGGKPVLWRFELAADGLIHSMRPFPQ